MRRIPSLDGFRAISIILVLASHCVIAPGFPDSLKDVARQGNIGVTIFFVISGFLITNLMLSEERMNGFIDFKAFYVRRAFRILPVFLLYTGFILVWKQFENVTVTHSDILHIFSFTVNFEKDHSWFIGHFWSLSVEEQFYLLLPLLLLLIRRKIKWILVGLILYSCLSRILNYKFPATGVYALAPFFIYSDAILVGSLGAFLHYENPAWLNLKIFSNKVARIIAVFIIGFFSYTTAHGRLAIISLPLGNTLISVSALYLIVSYIRPSATLGYKLLNSKIMVHIGVLSYSIYIWQQFFFTGQKLIFLRTFPQNLLFIYLVSLVSYYCWEQPFLNFRKRFFSVPRKTDKSLQEVTLIQTLPKIEGETIPGSESSI